MEKQRYGRSRQKACQPCSKAKARCDRQATCCSRCSLRSLQCTYAITAALKSPSKCPTKEPHEQRSHTPGPELGSGLASSEQLFVSPVSVVFGGPDTHLPITSPARVGAEITSFNPPYCHDQTTLEGPHSASVASQFLDFSDLELTCPIDADAICNRWLNSIIPIPGLPAKSYPFRIATLIHRTLKAYASKVVHGRGHPPFVHTQQLSARSDDSPLLTCLNLARICERPTTTGHDIAANVLKQEMNRLHALCGSCDTAALLAALQSYLIYIMVLYFQLQYGTNAFLRDIMITLQDIASSACKAGILCSAEQHHARPKWEAWIIAEATRRTLYTMYLFDSLLSSQDNLPTFLGLELTGLPAPASQQLWQAQARHDWETKYNVRLAAWPAGGLRIDELWPVPTNLDEVGVRTRQERVEQWVGDVDAFGMMLYAVTCCTHDS